jgi:hypothetical protein
MGYDTTASSVAMALLNFVNGVKEITFDHFYDGTDKTALESNRNLGSHSYDDEFYYYLDHAIYVLKELGMIETEQLKEKLADDELNFRIKITEKGEEFALSGQEIRINNSEA